MIDHKKHKKIGFLLKKITINALFSDFNFIIFCNITKIDKSNFLNLKNEIKKLKCKNLVSNPRLLNIQNLDLKFLGSHIIIIQGLNFDIFNKLISLLHFKNIWFFFLYLQNLSIILYPQFLEQELKKKSQIFNLNFILYRIIVRIFLILSIFLKSIIFTITFNRI